MKNLKQLRRCLLTGFLGLSLALVGCSGDDGAAGPAGADGATGPAGPVTETEESCNVCHGDGAFLVDLAADHQLEDEYFATDDVTITDFAVATGGVSAVVTFTVADADGAVAGVTPKIGFAKLTAGAGGDASYWTNYKNATEDTSASTAGPDGVPVLATSVKGSNFSCDTLTEAPVGTYTCEIADLTPAGNAEVVAWEPALTHRVAVYYGGHGAPVGQAAVDFVPATLVDGADTFAAAQTAVTVTRDIAVVTSCNECHGALAGHGGDRITVKNCVLCHNPGTQDANSGIVVDLTSMIHKIHRGADLTQTYTIWGHNDGEHDFTEVLYPEALTNCEKCHTAADAATPDGDNWKNVPTMNACGACHDNISFAATVPEGMVAHTGGARTDNSACAGCHSDTVIVGYHTVTPAAVDTPEFDVTITMTAPANGTHYVTGEAPVVTVTLAGVDGSVYTSTANDKGEVGGGLATADLDVYGPRAHAVPVLGAGSSLLASSANDETGFHFQLDAITDDLAPGTYMVRFEGGDYGAIASDDYVTMSTKLITFQIGTATEEPKVAGDCTGCHGDNRMHLQGAHPHNAAFNTDECLACHDFSGGYGTQLVRRVHAVHSASGLGADGHDRDWTEITYPQDVAHCQTCHNSTSDAFTEMPNGYALACVGCHGDVAGAPDHIAQNGGDI
jgi:OmcA/MtrC family decaheme c-type cytochrome